MSEISADKTCENGFSDSIARSRSKRQRVDKSGRLAALQKFKDLKGSKRKFDEDEEFKPVYELIDEKEYAKHVQRRQEDDWIIDDDGAGYVEDGREVFDDDEGDGLTKQESKRQKIKNPNVKKNVSVKANDIKSMFMSIPSNKKKSDKNVKLDEDDDVLGDIMQELNSEPIPSLKKTPSAKTSQKRNAVNPFRSRSEVTVPARNQTFKKPIRPRLVEDEINNIEIYDSQKSEDNFEIEDVDTQICLDVASVESKNQPENLWNDDITDEMFTDEIQTSVVDVNKQKIKSEKESKNLSEVDDKVDSDAIEWSAPKNSNKTAEVSIDSSKLPLITSDNGDSILKFYWLDAYEDIKRQNGTIYLFGKVFVKSVNSYVSCCVTVKNIDRRIYILPRTKKLVGTDEGEEPITLKDVYLEFNEKVTGKYKIQSFRSKKIKKNYAFSVAGVPEESDYLEIRYSAEYPTLPSDLSGDTFSHVFGTNTSCLEIFLLDRKMKGPCWLEVKSPQLSNPPISWCKVEAFVDRPSNVIVVAQNSSPPPLVVMTLSMPTVINSKNLQSEIVAVSCLVHEQFPVDKPPPSPPYQTHFCVLTKPNDAIFPYDFSSYLANQKITKIEKTECERALLSYLLAKIQRIDPDIIVGHDIVGFDLDVLLHRLNVQKVPNWSRIGRLKRSSFPKLPPSSRMQHIERELMSGRLICDVKLSAQELIRSKSYDLTELVQNVLHKNRRSVDNVEIRNAYNSSRSLLQLVKSAMLDSEYVVTLLCELNVLPLALQITNIAGNLFARTLLGGRSERNEYLLLHAFHNKNFVCPDKFYVKSNHKMDDGESTQIGKKGSKKSSYSGGLVLEPKKGFYDTLILLMDFNSLYPSIIQEYNICFTTIPQVTNKSDTEEDEIPDIPDPSLEPGILPAEIRKLVESRREVKKLMKNPDLSVELKQQYDIRQKALKLTANSMYGCLGFSHSRFYAKSLAALVTSRGREILMHTKELVETMNLEVIYGDTDSIMINTHTTDIGEVYKLGSKVKTEVNRAYRCLEIDIDGIFKSMLLLKKKKYAALTIQQGPNGQIKTSQEVKGLDIVRRDWSGLAKDAGHFVISEILSDQPRDSIINNVQGHLINLATDIENVPLSKFTITKQLTKDPSEYPNKKSLPHVLVALRMNSKGGKKIRRGDTVSYVVCKDGSDNPATQRSYHLDEMKDNSSLTIDFKYYLSQQVHPVVSRLCDPIEGTDAAAIAEFLGLDPSGYRHSYKTAEDDDTNILSNQMNDGERFRDCKRFEFECPMCKNRLVIDSAFVGSGSSIQPSLSKCSNTDCSFVPATQPNLLENKLIKTVRTHIAKYYQGWLVCDDASCSTRTRRLPVRMSRSGPVCHTCNKSTLHREYTDKQLYVQLCFYQHTFDLKKQLENRSDIEKSVGKRTGEKYSSCYRRLKHAVEQTLKRNAYSIVNLSRLFQNFALNSKIKN